MSDDRGMRAWFGARIGGGLVGSLADRRAAAARRAAVGGERLVRDALVGRPADPGRQRPKRCATRQYAPVLAANRAALETPFGSSWKGSAKPDVMMAYFYDYACGYCRKSNPDIDRLLAEDKGLRVVYRELPILGPDSVAAARVALAASKAGKFAAFHDALFAAGRPTQRDDRAASPAAGDHAPTQARDPAIEAELKREFRTRRAAGRDRHAAVRGRRPGDEFGGRL